MKAFCCPIVKPIWIFSVKNCLYFWHFLNTSPHNLGWYEPSSPPTKELHGVARWQWPQHSWNSGRFQLERTWVWIQSSFLEQSFLTQENYRSNQVKSKFCPVNYIEKTKINKKSSWMAKFCPVNCIEKTKINKESPWMAKFWHH